MFEDNWKKSVPDHVMYYRPPDSAQGFDIGASSKLRFSSHSLCDCMLFNGVKLVILECKSVGSKSISFERIKEDKGVIHKYQIDNLSKFATYKNVVSGFLLDFRLSDKTYFVHINDFCNLINQIEKKSFNENDMYMYCSPIIINKKKLKVNYRYDVEQFLSVISEI